MSGRSFRSVFMVASCAGAALGCYLVSLRVASERAALEQVETEIVMAERDIRLLQTEIGTRGRLAQLERWNVKVLALSAPSADQFLDGGFALAKLVAPEKLAPLEVPVVLASAPAPQLTTAPLEEGEQLDDTSVAPAAPAQLLHHASLKLPGREESPAAPLARNKAPKARQATTAAKPAAVGGNPSPRNEKAQASSDTKAAPAKSIASKTAAAKPSTAKVADKKSTEKKKVIAAKPVTKSTQLAKADPLAPLPESRSSRSLKDSGSAR